ncbi:nucleotidyltransferase family protein [Polaribacter sp.]|uniref:nucleotidyltransferase family protein n=1 Tax=Polaribacter sp. TaxID=1920175 RepID=UPI003F6A827F
MSTIAVLVLAAGQSSRMQSIKQLAKIDEKYLLEITLEKAKKIGLKNTICVLGANAETIKNQVNFNGIQIIINTNFEEGLSTSMIQGIHYLREKHTNINRVLILLADQPAIQESYLEEMVDLSSKNPSKIIASTYRKTYGVPALIPSLYFNDLLKIKGDKGAKTFLNSNQCSILSPKKNTNLIDIDTQEQLKQFINS